MLNIGNIEGCVNRSLGFTKRVFESQLGANISELIGPEFQGVRDVRSPGDQLAFNQSSKDKQGSIPWHPNNRRTSKFSHPMEDVVSAEHQSELPEKLSDMTIAQIKGLPSNSIEWKDIKQGMLIFSHDEGATFFVSAIRNSYIGGIWTRVYLFEYEADPIMRFTEPWSIGPVNRTQYSVIHWNDDVPSFGSNNPECCGQKMDWIACALKCQKCWRVL